MEIAHLRVEWLANPVGIGAALPRFSWELQSLARGKRQSAYRVLVASSVHLLDSETADVWDSGRVESSANTGVEFGGRSLKSGEAVFWKVKVWDERGCETPWSASARWTMGMLNAENWQAQWISRPENPFHSPSRDTLLLPPARYFRKKIAVIKPVERVLLYFSALGVCEVLLNGKKIGDSYFEPGWSDYGKRAYYRVYDVTPQVTTGANSIGAILADGWYAGYVGFGLFCGYGPEKNGRNLYGRIPALLLQMEIDYADGSREAVVTDASWEVSGDGPIREADLLMGETFDARQDDPLWCTPDHAVSHPAWDWEPALLSSASPLIPATFYDWRGERVVDLGFSAPPRLDSYAAEPIRITQELLPISIRHLSPDTVIGDFGQNFAGLVRLSVRGDSGSRVQLRYGEWLHSDGRLMTENLRRARATDTFILAGADTETWTPRFTYHGFQYVEISGLSDRVELVGITGLVMHNDFRLAGSFECSDPVMTKFADNVLWSQRSNFFEVPTDCPQRDERLGWLGDAQTFMRTATYFGDVAAFFTKWLQDVEDSQLDCGVFPDYSPFPMWHGQPFSVVWADAGIICPWTQWKVYGDTRLMERMWPSMERFMQWRSVTTRPDGTSSGLGNTYGDWLNLGEETPLAFIDTCYHAVCCRMMSEMAAARGDHGTASNYRHRLAGVGHAFRKAYINQEGTLTVDTQTAYALALWSEMLPAAENQRLAHRLAEKLRAAAFRMATGFVGTRALLPALSGNGYHDLAVKLFQSRDFPSWGYEVVNGANSVWERWDSFTGEYGFNGIHGDQNSSMNSFNHYAFGAVMEWAFRYLAGLDCENVGFRSLKMKPLVLQGIAQCSETITSVSAKYHSVHGLISSSWSLSQEAFFLACTIPANTTAVVHLPAFGGPETEDGRPLEEAPHVTVADRTPTETIVRVASGTYQFRVDRRLGLPDSQ